MGRTTSWVTRRITALQFFAGMGTLVIVSCLAAVALHYFYDLRFIIGVIGIDEANLYTRDLYEINMGVHLNNDLSYAQATQINQSSLQKLYDLRLYLAGYGVFYYAVFGWLYIKRLHDVNLSAWFSSLPLLLFYGALAYFFVEVREAFLKLDLSAIELFEVGTFISLPTKEGFMSVILPRLEFILMQSRDALLVLAIMSGVIFLSALLLFSRESPNHYGVKLNSGSYEKVMGLIMIVVSALLLYYLFHGIIIEEFFVPKKA